MDQDLTQRMILATWLVEFYLSKRNELDDMIASRSISQDVENLKAERTILEEEIRHFFETYKVRGMMLLLILNLTDLSLDKPRPHDHVRTYPRTGKDGLIPVLCYNHWRFRPSCRTLDPRGRVEQGD